MLEPDVRQAPEDPPGWCRIVIAELPWSPAGGVELSFRRPGEATPYLAATGWQASPAWLPLDAIALGEASATLRLGPPHTSRLSGVWVVEIGLRPAGDAAGAVSRRVKWPRMTLAAEDNPVGAPPAPPPPPPPPPQPPSPPPPPPPASPPEVAVLEAGPVLPSSADLESVGNRPEHRRWLWPVLAAIVAVGLLVPAYRYVERTPERQQPMPVERKFDEDQMRTFLGTDPPGPASVAEAQLYRDHGRSDLALLLYRDADRKGDPAAAKAIAQMYDPETYDKATSPFPAPNADQAASYYEKPAKAGDVESQVALGRLLIQGKTSGPSDIERGVVWLERAAKAGSAEATRLLDQAKAKPAGGN